jgi:hypothetical protein
LYYNIAVGVIGVLFNFTTTFFKFKPSVHEVFDELVKMTQITQETSNDGVFKKKTINTPLESSRDGTNNIKIGLLAS